MTYRRAADWVRDRRRFAAVLAAAVWAAWAGSLAAGDGNFDAVGQLFAGDHVAFYTPARMIRDGRERDIYDFSATAAYQAGLFPGKWDSLNAFRNPPFYALLYSPTAGLPYPVSALLWTGVSLVALVAGVRWLGVASPWRVTGWAVAFLPVYCVVSYGQNSLLSFAVFAGTYRLLANGRVFAAGLVAGLLCFKPTLLIGLVVWGILDIRKLWPAAVGVGVTGALLVGGSYAIVPGAWEAFIDYLPTIAAYNSFDQWKMHNPRAFWGLLSPDSGPILTVLTAGCSLAGVWVFFRVWRVRRTDLGVMFGAVVALTLWASPHTMVYEWALAVIPAALWWEHDARHRDEWLVIFAVVWAAFQTGTDVARGLSWVEREMFGWGREYLLQYTVIAVAWAGWKAARLLANADSAGRADDSAVNPAGPPVTTP